MPTVTDMYIYLSINVEERPPPREPHREPPRERNCESFDRHCESLVCPYGVRKTYDGNCERCECEDPCAEHECPIDSKCSVDYVDQSGQPVASCKKFKKPGQCPRIEQYNARCDTTECHDDSDCRGEDKCCQAGCTKVCAEPVQQSQPPPYHPRPPQREIQAPVLDDVPEENLRPVAREGGVATLRCFATGFPPPSITWKRGGIEVRIQS